jgi:spermidine synthase
MIGTKTLEERESKYNGHLKVIKSFGLGTYIQANGLTQSGGIVETIWNTTLKKVKSQFSISSLNSCLILGFGGGTVAKLIRKNCPKAKITGVDIDPIMIDLGKKYLKLDDYNIKTIVGDAVTFPNLPKFPNSKFDLIIIDLYNGDRFPEKFETNNYIHLVRMNLSRSGAAIFNRLYYGEKRPAAVRFGNKLQKIFKKVEWFYPEANLMFICS